MIRVLDISSYIIFPPTSGGAQRIIRPLSNLQLEDGIQVDIIYTANTNQCEESAKYLEMYPCVGKAVAVRPKIDLSDERAKPEGFSSDVWKTMGKELKDAAVELVRSKFYDIIQIEHSMMAWILPYLKEESPNSKFVLDLHNAEYRIYEKWLEYAKPEQVDSVKKKYEELFAWEMATWRWFDAVLTVSSVESEMFRTVTGCKHVYEVPTGGGIDLQEYVPVDEEREKPYDLLYMGTLKWYPNSQGLIWFIKHVFPEVLEKRPETKLHIVGYGEPDEELLALTKENSNIVFWGQQDDDKHFFQGAKVFVVPLFIGAGARVKVPTAWASKVPVASTVFGPEGLEAIEGVNICMSNDPVEYAQNIVKLLNDENYAQVIADNAFDTVKKKYTSHMCVEKLKMAYKSILT